VNDTERDALNNLTRNVESLDRALTGVIERATKAQHDLRLGLRASFPGFTVLGQQATDVETHAAQIEVLLSVIHVEPEVLQAAYSKPFTS